MVVVPRYILWYALVRSGNILCSLHQFSCYSKKLILFFSYERHSKSYWMFADFFSVFYIYIGLFMCGLGGGIYFRDSRYVVVWISQRLIVRD